MRWERETAYPKHGSGHILADDVVGLEFDDVRSIVGDEFLLRGIVRVAGALGSVLSDGGTSHW